MISPYSLRHKCCCWCKHCINEQNNPGQFICAQECKRYSTDKLDDYGMPEIPCINGKFEVNENLLIGRRW